jgi:hypothetical protein
VQDNGEEGHGLGIVVGVVNDRGHMNWVVRREIRASHRKSAPLWIHSLSWGVLYCREN